MTMTLQWPRQMTRTTAMQCSTYYAQCSLFYPGLANYFWGCWWTSFGALHLGRSCQASINSKAIRIPTTKEREWDNKKQKSNNPNTKTNTNRRVEERGAIFGFLTGLAFVAWIGYFSLLLFIQSVPFLFRSSGKGFFWLVYIQFLISKLSSSNSKPI